MRNLSTFALEIERTDNHEPTRVSVVLSSSSAVTCVGSATFDISTMSGAPRIAAARSARPSLSIGLIRTAARMPAARHAE